VTRSALRLPGVGAATAPARPRLRPALLAAGLVVALLAALAGPVQAESAAEAEAAAAAAAADVAALQPRIAAATAEYERAVNDVASAVIRGVSADRRADALDRSAAAAERQERTRLRMLYMSGGSAGVWSSVLQAGNPNDALHRIEQARRVVTAGGAAADRARLVAADAEQAAADAQPQLQLAVATAGDAEAAYARVAALLAAAESRLNDLDERARQARAAEAAAEALRRLRTQADAQAGAAAARATARTVPGGYFALYKAAAATCPGLRWEVVAAIGQVETGHGTNVKVSSAGAQGPMQFMPATFAAYGVDGGGDGRIDIWDPADSVFSAANYLCANGAGSPRKLRGAIWRYNHADWYVAMVLRIADQLAAKAGAPPVSPPV
jgi:membrane-bound lytic murein transglycosylase B